MSSACPMLPSNQYCSPSRCRATAVSGCHGPALLIQRERLLEIRTRLCEVAFALPHGTAGAQGVRRADVFANPLTNRERALCECQSLIECLWIARDLVGEHLDQLLEVGGELREIGLGLSLTYGDRLT